MATVYEVNRIRFTKDMVFGWTLLEDEQFYPINQMDREQIAFLESLGSFPAYVPDEFAASIRTQKNKLLAEEVKPPAGEKTQSSLSSAATVSVEEGARRLTDRINLLSKILEKMKPNGLTRISSDLGYGIVSRQDEKDGISNVWIFEPTNGGSLPKQMFASIDDLVTWVLRVFW